MFSSCLRFFLSPAEYGPTFVEWINDSCCNVLFADQQAAKRAVFGMGKPLPPEDIPDGQSASKARLRRVCSRSYICSLPMKQWAHLSASLLPSRYQQCSVLLLQAWRRMTSGT